MRAALAALAAMTVARGAVGERLFTSQPPKWEPQYLMEKSTIFMPCNDSGYFDPDFAAEFGVADFDWSNAKQLWANDRPMRCEERLVEQAKMVKQRDNSTRVFVYRNFVKALPWYTSVREKITDPAYSGWFLQFKDYKGPSSNHSYHVPACTYEKCSGFYHDQDQTPYYPHGDGSCHQECDCGEDLPCGEYLWDHRNDTLREWLINDFALGATGLGSPYVDGFYFDDGWTNKPYKREPWWPKEGFCSADAFGGPTEEYPNCTADMGLSQQDVDDIYNGWQATMAATYQAVIDHGGLPWPYLAENTVASPSKAGDTCNAAMKKYCEPTGSPPAVPALFEYTKSSGGHVSPLPQPDVDIAYFLLSRGPYSWLGYAWSGCTNNEQPGASGYEYAIPAGVKRDYGTPNGPCVEQSPKSGVWIRDWSKATVQLDCNTLTPTITMKDKA